MRYVHVGRLQLAAKNRKPGVIDAYNKAGKMVQIRGKPFLQLTDADYQIIRAQYAIARPPAVKPRPYTPPASGKIGLGDLVSKFATPIARRLRMNCIDQATGLLKPGVPCARRKATLNKIQIPTSLKTS
jgi:hypothetical protein